MEVINDLLNYNGLKIVQNTDWFKFSLDSVLLANFAKVKNNQSIIDFCSGNAPIPLFLSTRTSSNIIGVELQKEIYDLAIKSIKINNLSKQILMLNEDVKNVSKIYETDTFDVITCNPPYFRIDENNKLCDNKIKATARHELNLNLDNIFSCARKILKNNGKICMVHKSERLVDIICAMKKYNIEPKRIQFIYPKENEISNMILIEGAKNGGSGIKIESPLIVHENNGKYTKYVLNIFNGGKYEN